MRISDWSSDVCSSDLARRVQLHRRPGQQGVDEAGEHRADAGGEVVAEAEGWVLVHVGALGELELHGVDAVRGTPMAAGDVAALEAAVGGVRSEEHTSELQSLMRITYAVFCLKKKIKKQNKTKINKTHEVK